MKLNKQLLVVLIAITVIAALYRIVPGRPFGFAPQIAIAIFAGALVKPSKYAFLLPLISMVLSDFIFELLYKAGITTMYGFYEGQWLNYLLFLLLTFVGVYMKKVTLVRVIAASFIGPTLYFLLSNTLVWYSGGGMQHPATMQGLMMTLADGVPFYKNSVLATLVFNALFFGGWYLLTSSKREMLYVKR